MAAAADVQTEVAALRAWMSTEPHLPQDIEDQLLLQFLHSCYYDMEKTKTCVELFFSLRAALPELLKKRDPMSNDIQKQQKIVNLGCTKLSGNRNLFVWQVNDPGLNIYEYIQDLRVFLLSSDAWLMENDHLYDSDVVLLDVKDISLKYITKFNVSIARKLTKYQQDAIPFRLEQIHVVNAPSFFDKLYGLLKPFLKPQIRKLIHFHKPNSDTLHSYIDKDDLPADYGGNGPKMADINKITVDRILRNRELFLRDDVWISDETKRTKTSKNKNKPIVSLRSLAID